MITHDQLQTVLNQPVYDNNGEKVGKVEHVYVDDATGRPAWLCVRTGLFGMNETFVPVQTANVVGDHIEVALDKDRIKDAPNIDVESGGHMSAEEERELYRYYDIDWEGSWQEANRTGETGEAGWAHTGGLRERERMGRTAGLDGERGIHTGGVDHDGLGRTGGLRGHGRADHHGLGHTDHTGHTGDDAMTRSEERLDVGTESHEAGRARLRKYVVTDHEQVTVPVTREEVRVEREPITDSNIDDALGGPEITESEHEVILREERPTVEKRTVPVERVRMSKDRVTDEETVSENVRKERIEAEGDARGIGRDRTL
ncbi:PRC and DUF2382 domain-containing protein [Streptosporangium sandarakinum]|uniref:PRC and DUF2382 domain-containing protein n=1 Tax=Streptosporangium sandarakinum TaxID=1260955 RepID=UPI00343A3953